VAGLVNRAGSEVGWWRCPELGVPTLGTQRKENGVGNGYGDDQGGGGLFL
jgi:hypothetical protein